MTDLQEAFREAARLEFAMVPDESELDYTFSPGFQRKMQRIIRAQVHGYWNMVNTLGKRIAIAAAIIVMLLTTTMAIKPIRERVINFFVDVYEEYFDIGFGKEKRGDLYSPPEPMTRYTIQTLPDGYLETERLILDTLFWITWHNDNGNGISFRQEIGIQNITIDTNDVIPSIINHNNLNIMHYCGDNTNSFLWEQHGYTFYLTTHKNIPLDNAIHMIDSLVEEKN